MLVAVCVLAWLLICTWITVIVVGIDQHYKGHEWAGVIISCLFSPLMVFIVRPIVLSIEKAKKRRKRK